MKHKEIHAENQSLKCCHYFNNQKVCLFKEIGCKFLHTKSSKCRFAECNNQLCPFSHADEDQNNLHVDEEGQAEHLEFEHPKDVIEEEIENVTGEATDEAMGENDCHLCSVMFESLEHLCEHLRTEHVVTAQLNLMSLPGV